MPSWLEKVRLCRYLLTNNRLGAIGIKCYGENWSVCLRRSLLWRKAGTSGVVHPIGTVTFPSTVLHCVSVTASLPEVTYKAQ